MNCWVEDLSLSSVQVAGAWSREIDPGHFQIASSLLLLLKMKMMELIARHPNVLLVGLEDGVLFSFSSCFVSPKVSHFLLSSLFYITETCNKFKKEEIDSAASNEESGDGL